MIGFLYKPVGKYYKSECVFVCLLPFHGLTSQSIIMKFCRNVVRVTEKNIEYFYPDKKGMCVRNIKITFSTTRMMSRAKLVYYYKH